MDELKIMNKYKSDFVIRFAQLMQDRLPVWKQIQNEERAGLYSLAAFGIYFGTAALGFLPGKREYDYDLKLHCWIALFFFIGAIIINIHCTNKSYQNRVKGTFFSELLTVFGENVKYAGDTVSELLSLSEHSQLNVNDITSLLEDMSVTDNLESKIPNSVFESSMLYPKNITQRTDDDRFYGTFKEVKFKINETDFGWEENNKHRTYHSMFKGVAMQFTMNKRIKSRVLILSKHSFVKVPRNFERVKVEYEKFNKKYDVWVSKNVIGGTGQIEARYLLNTAFLDRFMQLHTSFKVNKICSSVFDNQMLVMLNTKRDLFEMNHLLLPIDRVNQYESLFDEFASVFSFIEVLNLSGKTRL